VEVVEIAAGAVDVIVVVEAAIKQTRRSTMITVVNIKDVFDFRKRDISHTIYVYVGRNTKRAKDAYLLPMTEFGNPFLIGKDGTREVVCEKYRIYFDWRMKTSPNFPKLLYSLAVIAEGLDLVLVCHCAPLQCHATTIKEAIEALKGKLNHG
jgi:hypothetical protein